jgi:hypothetical protein
MKPSAGIDMRRLLERFPTWQKQSCLDEKKGRRLGDVSPRPKAGGGQIIALS